MPQSKRGTTPIDEQDATRPPETLSMTPCYYRVDRRDISLLRFILEAYEGVATLTTVDAAAGIVKIGIAPGREPLVKDLLATLCTSREILLEPVPAPPPAIEGIP